MEIKYQFQVDNSHFVIVLIHDKYESYRKVQLYCVDLYDNFTKLQLTL